MKTITRTIHQRNRELMNRYKQAAKERARFEKLAESRQLSDWAVTPSGNIAKRK